MQPLPKIIEVSEPHDGVHEWALTCHWPDGTETVELVSTHAAALLGFIPSLHEREA